jgi:hypothetical protein
MENLINDATNLVSKEESTWKTQIDARRRDKKFSV